MGCRNGATEAFLFRDM